MNKQLLIAAALIVLAAGGTYVVINKDALFTINANNDGVTNVQQQTQQATQTTNQTQTTQTAKTTTTSSCGMKLTVTGGTFTPTTCVFLEVLPGVPCGTNTTCPLDYTVSLKDGTVGHIAELGLIYFDEPSGTFTHNQSTNEFYGYIIDSKYANRNLVTGTLSLDPVTSELIKADFDVTFEDGTHITGSGTLPIKKEAAP